MDRRQFSASLAALLAGAQALKTRAFGAAVVPMPPTGLAIDGAQAPQSPVTAGSLKVNSGVVSIPTGSTADVTINCGFAPAAIIFYSTATFYQRTMTYGANLPLIGGQSATGSARGICMGAFDGVSQWSQQHAVTFIDGRRDGYLWTDAVYDAGENLGGGSNMLGARVVGKSIAGNVVTLGVQRAPLVTDGAVTMHWIAVGGCNAKVGSFSVPHGNYHANPPQGVTVQGLPFQPKGVIFAPWRQTLAGSTFFTATSGSAIGFASGAALAQQAAVGASDGYGGHVLSFAYQGCIAGPSRQDHADSPTYLATLKRFTSDGFVLDFQSSDDTYANDQLTYIALDCSCYAGSASMLAGTGPINITGAGFTPLAALFGAVPAVESNYTTPWAALNYGTNGDENTSFGYAVNSNGTVKQGGISWFDKGGYDAAGNLVTVNGHELDSTAMHDGSYLSFVDAIAKGQARTAFQTFVESGKVAFTQFVAGGVQLTQVQTSGRAGKLAFLLLGN